MEQVIQSLKLAFFTVLAVASSIYTCVKSPTFEQVVLAALILAPLLLFFDILSLLKVIYAIITRKRLKKVLDQKVQEKQIAKKPKNKFLKRIYSFTKPVRIFFKSLDIKNLLIRIFIWPISLRRFALKKNTYKELRVLKFKVRIPFLAIWVPKLILINAVVILFLFVNLKKQFTTYPQYKAVFPKENAVWNDYNRPLEIEFDVPINKDSLIINMAPEAEGTWEYERSFSFLPFIRRIKFHPTETIFPDEEILVYLTDLTNHFHTMKGGEHLVKYKSISLPEVVSSTPENKQIDVPVDRDIQIFLNQNDGAYVEWEFVFDKDVDYEVVRNNSKTITLALQKNLTQGEVYKLEVSHVPLSSNVETGEIIKKGEKVSAYSIEFTTVSAPLVESVEPTGTTVLPEAVIKIIFEDNMDKESVEEAFSLSPETEGEITWEDDRTFIFTPTNPLPKETHFEIIFAQGIRSQAGGFSEEEIKFSFDTIGKVKVIGWSPGYGATNVQIGTNINVTFDQQVDHASAQGKFSISPSASGAFSWSGNTMIFDPSASLGYSTTYTITIAAGVKTVYGLDSNQNFSSHFTTQHNVFILDVPQYRQTHAFTCNVTAAAIALSYKGAASSEMGVYSGVAKDNTPCTMDGDTITYWGNPNAGFVGDINGGGTCGGYGVYWGPIASYINSRGRSAGIRNNWNYISLVQEVEQGNPVVIWWQNGWANPSWPPKSWNSPSGYSYGVNGMHSEVVIGFVGPSSNPSQIITQDPWRGRRYHSVGAFDSLWGRYALGGGSVRNAVVVY